MRILQVAWALALCAGVALQLICDGQAGSKASSAGLAHGNAVSKANAIANANAHGSHFYVARRGSGRPLAMRNTSGDASSGSGDASGTANSASDDGSETATATSSSDGRSGEDKSDDSADSSSSNETADAKPSGHRLQDVMRAWSTVKQMLSLKYIGMTVMLTFLNLNPEYQPFFKNLIGVTKEKMQKDNKFIALSVSLMYNLDSLLDNLDDEELVEELAKQVGKQFAVLGIKEKPFMDLRNLIVFLMERYHKRHVSNFPLGIVESASHTIGWLWSLAVEGIRANGGGGDGGEARRHAPRPHLRPRQHPHVPSRAIPHGHFRPV